MQTPELPARQNSNIIHYTCEDVMKLRNDFSSKGMLFTEDSEGTESLNGLRLDGYFDNIQTAWIKIYGKVWPVGAIQLFINRYRTEGRVIQIKSGHSFDNYYEEAITAEGERSTSKGLLLKRSDFLLVEAPELGNLEDENNFFLEISQGLAQRMFLELNELYLTIPRLQITSKKQNSALEKLVNIMLPEQIAATIARNTVNQVYSDASAYKNIAGWWSDLLVSFNDARLNASGWQHFLNKRYHCF